MENNDNVGRLQTLIMINSLVLCGVYYWFSYQYGNSPFAFVPFLPGQN